MKKSILQYKYGKVSVPETGSALLSQNSKTQTVAWDIPAGDPEICAGIDLSPGSICLSCYACKGRQAMPVPRNAQRARFEWWNTTAPAWREKYMAAAINREVRLGRSFFRVFGSGDFDSIGSVKSWARVAKLAPAAKLWIPTRTWKLFEPALSCLNRLENVTVRASGLRLDHVPDTNLPVAIVTATGGNCPAQHGGQCRDCRRCWTSPDWSPVYAKH